MRSRPVRIGLLLMLVLGIGWSVAHAAIGDLDPTFDSDGLVTTNFHNTPDEARAVAIQPDGKIVVVGTTHISGNNYNFSVARYNVDGSPDTTFSGDGHLTTDLFNDDYQSGGNDGANAVAIQSDDKIVAVGHHFGANFAVVRYHPDGSLDTGFGQDGRGIYGGGGLSRAYGVALQDDSKIVLVGYTHAFQSSNLNWSLVRLNANGSLDTTFSGDGKVTTDFFGGADEARAVVVRHDGKIVVAGYAQVSDGNYDFALARYLPNGDLDDSFEGHGKTTRDFFGADDKAFAMAWQDDGNFLLAGHSYNAFGGYDFGVARFHGDGSVDTTFDLDGIQAINFVDGVVEEVAFGVAQQADRKIVVAGYVPAGGGANDFGLVRLNADGSLDTAFGTSGNGRVTHDFGGGVAIAYGVAVQLDGRIVTAGTAYMGDTNNYDFALARYLANDLPTPTPTPPAWFMYLPVVVK